MARITDMCGRLLNANCALYATAETGQLEASHHWVSASRQQHSSRHLLQACSGVLDADGPESIFVRPMSCSIGRATAIGTLVRCSGRPVGVLCAGIDASLPADDCRLVLTLLASALRAEEERRRTENERIAMERRVLHVQKLESLGVLAGGIAHDFNNLLMAVLGHADLALMELPQMSPARSNLAEIGKAARRAADLCGQMLAYSGRGRFVLELIDLSELVSEMTHLLGASISKKASLRLDLSGGLPSVMGDATQIRQIVMNLITNASEAVGDSEGVVRVSTGKLDLAERDLGGALLGDECQAGAYV